MSHERQEQTQAPDVVELYGSLINPNLIYYPERTNIKDLEERFLDNIASIKQNGGHIAIVDGAYDVPHDSHAWYLRDCRRVAAERHYGFSTSDMVAAGRTNEAQELIASSDIFFIVTLDADIKVSRLKGGDPNKGGAIRPIYPWEARANRIGGYMIPDGAGGHRPVLDLIVPEGDDAHELTMFESHLTFGKQLADSGLLDSWIFYGEHSKNLENAKNIIDNPEDIKTIPMHQGYSKDPRTGEEWHSSEIIKLIRS